MKIIATHFETPLGETLAVCDGSGALLELSLLGPDSRATGEPRIQKGDEVVWDRAGAAAVRTQLSEYFAGERSAFDLRLAPRGTVFQRRVWDALLGIPYGEKTSYSQIAKQLGNPGASRAVGLANGKNPIWIVIPCHRVVGADGSLTGYAGGVAVKQALLELEGSCAQGRLFG